MCHLQSNSIITFLLFNALADQLPFCIYGREELEIDEQKRSAHRFGAIDIVEGSWSEIQPRQVDR